MTTKAPEIWDTFDAYLFDIDGTLIHCADAVHYFAFCHALSAIAQRPLNLDGVTAHGNTDIGILRDAFALAEIPPEIWRPQLSTICDSIRRFVDDRKHEFKIDILPRVGNLLSHLRARDAILGVATGNLEAIGKHKLHAVGLLNFFTFGGWSDAFEIRADVVQDAASKARQLAGSAAKILVIGDTPEDIRSAKLNGLSVLAVATGIHSRQRLEAEAPDLCVASFLELGFQHEPGLHYAARSGHAQ